MKINAISQNFPLAHSYTNISPFNRKSDKPQIRTFNNIKNGYNNETPDFFRIDSMKESSYYYSNPYLGEVIHEDRKKFFKNNTKIRDQVVNLIDKLKTKKEYSQNSDFLKCVRSSYDFELNNKREAGSEDKKLTRNRSSFVEERMRPSESRYVDTSSKISKMYGEKHHFYFKNKIDNDKNELGTLEDPKLKLKLSIDPKKSSYLNNYNDYDIKENYDNNEDRYISHEKKEIENYDSVGNLERKIKPGKYVNQKWSSFYDK